MSMSPYWPTTTSEVVVTTKDGKGRAFVMRGSARMVEMNSDYNGVSLTIEMTPNMTITHTNENNTKHFPGGL